MSSGGIVEEILQMVPHPPFTITPCQHLKLLLSTRPIDPQTPSMLEPIDARLLSPPLAGRGSSRKT